MGKFPTVDADGHLEEVHINEWRRSSVRRATATCASSWKASRGPNQVDLASALEDLIVVRILDARAADRITFSNGVLSIPE